MKVFFSHGQESGPWGTKIQRLAAIAKEQDFNVDSIDYSDIPDPDLRVEHLVSVLNNEKDSFILVGSSMGGYVSLVASEQVKSKGIFLLAPALYMKGYKIQSYSFDIPNIEIVHGWSDDVIPLENSIKFAKKADCSLHLICADHRLNSPSSLKTIEILFSSFLSRQEHRKQL